MYRVWSDLIKYQGLIVCNKLVPQGMIALEFYSGYVRQGFERSRYGQARREHPGSPSLPSGQTNGPS